MKNYLLTKDLFQELIYGTKPNQAKIVTTLEDMIKKNNSLHVTIISLNHILENETSVEKRKKILNNINLLCEKILPVDKDDLPLALGLETEYGIDHTVATELIIAKKTGMDYILDITEKYTFQKMISVVSIILEAK